ncbi:MAG: hypothetical protein WB615_00440 [Candidatus Tumulicola sp.]
MNVANVAVVLLTAAVSVSAQAHQSDCARDEFVGPVHTVVTTMQTLQTGADGKPDTSQVLVADVTYDRACNLVASKEYKGDFVDDQHFERVDATTVIVHSNMGDRTVSERYDEKGRLAESRTASEKSDFVEHSLYSYDGSDRVIRVDSLDAAGKPDGFTAFSRDPNGHIVRQVFHFGDGRSQTTISEYEFDRFGNWIKEFDSGDDADHAEQGIRPRDILFRKITYYRV